MNCLSLEPVLHCQMRLELYKTACARICLYTKLEWQHYMLAEGVQQQQNVFARRLC